ncbi:SEC-C metal-binding domain-containing protein [Sphingosinicella sp. LY1275]|uniref:SEC-C metal-binding domain-containing protein n=1 Tax=Sphingosinicella sp. LY1275 TaxID=3095379 RepID=UPI002ADEEA8D|nr:SEC-C metal-binding domain-containing protein [Sphingosinicella sp. LY1275]MEA1014180.1 SEC-C metal-binding domain-containing protein [Sphingosinicella sp. LY1275]
MAVPPHVPCGKMHRFGDVAQAGGLGLGMTTYSSDTRVKRGLRFVRGGEVELVEKLGRKDPCPCGSGKSFQALLPAWRPVSAAPSGMITGGIDYRFGGGGGTRPGSDF